MLCPRIRPPWTLTTTYPQASGTVGSPITSVLTEPDSTFTITIITRIDSKADFTSILEQTPTITLIRLDYTFDSLRDAFRNQDAVISATSVFTIDIQTTILDAAKAAGVKRFILNEFANSPVFQTGLPELMPYREVKDRVRQHAQKLSDESSSSADSGEPSFTWTGIATGNLTDLSLKKYPIFGFDLQNRMARLVDDGLEPFTGTTLHDIGIAVRGVLLHPSETANRYVHVRSLHSTQSGMLNALETATGAAWPVTHVSSRELLENGRREFVAGNRKGMLDLLVAQLFERGAGRSVVVSEEECDNALVGVQEKPVDVIVRDVLGL